MENNAYYALSNGYDRLNSETDYTSWADFLCDAFKKYGKNISSVLDMGCGTGSMTFELHKRGFDMTGLDISEDMLAVASETAYDNDISDILWLCQDMSEFELYGTVGAIICCLDGINHLTKETDLKKCLKLVQNYLDYDGLFIFDINSRHKFENFYANNNYILEDDGVMCCWQNDYDSESRICNFYLTVFEENEEGLWERTDALQQERCYDLDYLKSSIEEAGLKYYGAFSDFNYDEVHEDTDRIYIICGKTAN